MSSRRTEPFDVLLVEDDPTDRDLTRDAFEQLPVDVTFTVTPDGETALEELSQRQADESAELPALVLLDLDLPNVDGYAFLETIREDASLVRLPVIVLASSDTEEDVQRSYELAANAYLTKPTEPEAFYSLAKAVSEFWFEHVLLPPASGSK
ncbi:receiver box response regulator [Natrialba magadii ATCC 43099]|uniref:Receiver box response regulator n=1 Tax=Natrialba magadii (strain ATCC 43099 / DSM 3394 / CCM 3739 / CIP 104546 / IAM 13178 / JCM 8861 / NBRC 102185 / NCIMB 2190 / MS3) TaxID=547559 RepID=D3ST62_NATMM|nr:response regulator [Natrialba magadii]ADD06929.1 receiver box response regulator [Natrialba magadii ATCC 43099]ELY28447.1 response regulator receiver protein [Natrialba magadii ATCC 43099]